MTPLARLLALRVELRDEAVAAEVTPETLAAYAEARGWRLVETTAAARVYHRDEAPEAELQIPLEAGWRDYPRRFLAELRELAAAEGRSPLAIWADLVGLGEPTPEDADCRAVAAPSRGDRPAALPLPSPEPPQGVLPGMEANPRRRGTHHVYGPFAPREFAAGPLAPDSTVTHLVRACRSCSCLHRVTSAGPRQGQRDLYSMDGVEWKEQNPACTMKRRD
jgi:hypothetical protein